MKVRISAMIAILALAAWLPIQAQQAGAPNAPATQTTGAPDGKGKDTAEHKCCHPKALASQETAQEKPDQAAAECCHGKDATKTSCCAGKEAKDMAACCGQKEAAGKPASNCCAGKQDTMCAAKISKNCCSKMNTKDGMSSCATHPNGK